jgi:predicted dehydrogenase
MPVSAADQIALAGTLRNAAVVSAFYRGDASHGDNLRWDINGTEGELVLTAANGNLQVADLRLCGGRGGDASLSSIGLPSMFERSPHPSLRGVAENVLFEYEALARDLREDTRHVPGFDYALERHRLLAAIERAAASGTTQHLCA